MGMRIDEAIDIMEHYDRYGLISQQRGRNKAIEIMCKYRRIRNIFLTQTYTDEEVIEKIKEVIKVE